MINRILTAGAIIFTLTAGFFAGLIIAHIVQTYRTWQELAHTGGIGQLISLPLAVLALPVTVAFPIGVWRRIARQHNIANALANNTHYPYWFIR